LSVDAVVSVGVAVEDVAVDEVGLYGAQLGAVGGGEGVLEGAGDGLPHRGAGLLLLTPVEDELLALQGLKERLCDRLHLGLVLRGELWLRLRQDVEEPPYPAALRRSLARNEDALDDLGGDNIAPSLADELTKAEEAFYEKVRKLVVGEGRASTVMCCRLSSILSLSCQVPPSRA
jgi:hypothetical protein